MDDPINTHALRYAAEATKIWLMEKYKVEFPVYFDFAHITKRPATSEDYYIPPSLAQTSFVVEETYFEEIACRRLSCFPFKDNWEPCTEQDLPQWVQIGEHLELACQLVCRDHTIHADWINDRCIVSNPLKKAFASMPEKVFDRASRHIYHGGLNVVEGTIKLNSKYCEAYGLDFANDDCIQTGWQTFLEWLMGMTTTRAMRTAHIQPFVLNAPPVPNYLHYAAPPKRIRDSRSMLSEEEEDNAKAFKEIAESLVKDLGENITQWSVQSFMRKKAPALLTKSIDKIAAKLVIKHSIATSIKGAASLGLKILGKGFNIVTAIFAIYDIIITVIDSLDINDYTKILDKETLYKVNKELDYNYFQDGTVRPELTPEYIWNHNVLKEDEREKIEYMVEKVEEYLKAVHVARPSGIGRVKLFQWKEEEKQWNKFAFLALAVMAIVVIIVYVEWIDIWANVLFFFKVLHKL